MHNDSHFTARRDHYLIHTDKTLLDVDWIHRSLTMSHWAKHIPREKVERSLNHSLCFGMYDLQYARPSGRGNQRTLYKQMAIARVISDFTTFAYLCDVYLDEAYRGKKLSKWLISSIKNHQIRSYWVTKLQIKSKNPMNREYSLRLL